ncbi:CDP-glycerol glycerophosphotransferase family protein [Leucobacter chinensis]|uniref:CDP-glycerol glycerophosphotransferase family protein n=1 Tax=Leucobacter chinensis TaxID=2851010 RepID=UPI001C2451B6|nr:CDP-glycerol glycerophosphotransferase family protein [Leucobacter chinensis]
MKTILSMLLRVVMTLQYTILKRCTRVDPCKIVFLGRHSDTIPRDFAMLKDELESRHADVKIVVLTQRFEGGWRATLRFTPVLLRSVFHLATAKVCMLDSYWPAVSLLNHREELVVYQMWHSLGKMKKTGLQAVGKTQGRSRALASSLRMHEGYDYVVAGAPVWNEAYCEAFGVEEAQLLNIGLPRADYLINSRESIAQRVLARYPELQSKPVIMYAPTFRRSSTPSPGAQLLAEAIERDKFHLLIRSHKDDHLLLPEGEFFTCPDFTGPELLTVADVLVTDYSSIALEGALLDLPTYYFMYDYDQYMHESGTNIDPGKEMPRSVFREANKLAASLLGEYPTADLRRYKEKFVFPNPGSSTKALVDHIYREGGLCAIS